MVHIKLITIKRQLQEKMHYPLTKEEAGEWFLTLDEAFDELLYGYFKQALRASGGKVAAASKAIVLKRGWMTEKLADNFTDYCINGWKIV